MRCRRLTAAFACLTLALPAAAAAQSAGDQQYSDPFAGQTPSGGNGGTGGGGSGGGGSAGGQGGDGTASPSPGPAAQAGQQGSSSSGSQAVDASPGDTLPHTGLPVAILALLGGAFLLGGGVLRRGSAPLQLAPSYLQGGALRRRRRRHPRFRR
jgi:hypothetical protein